MNVIYKHELYNNEHKARFLATLPSTTVHNYRRAFLRAYKTESWLGKDIYAFAYDETDRLVADEQAPTLVSVRFFVNVVSAYVDWCIAEGLTGVNHFKALSQSPDFPRRHIKPNKWITEEELGYITDACDNAQDAVLFQLLFEGVGGDGLQEIISLTIDDVNFTHNMLILRNKYGRRAFGASPKLMSLIRRAYAEGDYLFRRGNSSKLATAKLVESRHILRLAQVGAGADARITRNTIWHRVKTILKRLGYDMPMSMIEHSGMLHYAHALWEKHGKLEKEQYEEIAKKFAHNFWWAIRDRISIEDIQKLANSKERDNSGAAYCRGGN